MTDHLQRQSYWNATADAPDFPALAGDIQVDVAIVGGGIVGTTTARLLKDKGQSVALVEARKVGRQVTGKSTAKLTSQHGLKYQTLADNFGEDGARLYAEAQEQGIATIRGLAIEHGIDAEIEDKPAFVWTRDEDFVAKIEREAELARKLGLPASLTRETGLPFEVLAAMRFDNQAQLHPTKFVAGLARTIPGGGCHVFEDSRAVDWEPTRVVTEGGSVSARHVVMTTHLPLGQIGGYYTQAHPRAEAVIAARIDDAPEGMFINAEQPHLSLRTRRGADGAAWAISTGPSFKPGDTDGEREAFATLEDWLTGNFAVGAIAHRWVNEDYDPIDGAPFIGWSSSGGDGYLVATGFAGWGISNGAAAAIMLTDLAMGKDHPWLGVFDATRVKPAAGAAKFIKGNLGVARHLIGGYLKSKPKAFDALAPGEAAILKIDGDDVAAFRDEQGTVHAVPAACTHMGCLVGWNATDRSWDCPCHGSRFALDGEVIAGPATKPLGSAITG